MSWRAFSADGHEVRWTTWDGGHEEQLTLRWENEAWTATGQVGRERIAVRAARCRRRGGSASSCCSATLDEPDLWLATDGHARWGEVNGAHRPELDGCHDIELACSPFPATLPIRRLPLDVGDDATLPVLAVDVETLAVDVAARRYERVAERRWRRTDLDADEEVEFDVDAYGVVIDHPGRFRRTS